MIGEIVITGTGLSLAHFSETGEFEKSFRNGRLSLAHEPISQSPELAVRLEDEIRQLNATGTKIAGFTQRKKKDVGIRLSGEGSYEVYCAVKRALKEAGASKRKKGFDYRQTVVANCILYQGMEKEVGIKPFKFQTEHQSPWYVGDIFNFQGPHFTFKEGEEASLSALTSVLPLIGSGLHSSAIISGVAQPNALFTRIECLDELRRLRNAYPSIGNPAIETRFSETAAALLFESADQANKRGVKALAKYLGGISHHRTIDYKNADEIAVEIERILESLSNSIEREIGIIFIDHTWNRILYELQLNAIAKRFPGIPIVSLAKQTGNCLAVNGLLNVVLATRGLQDGIFPETVNGSWKLNPNTRANIQYLPDIDCAVVFSMSRLGGLSAIALGKMGAC